MTQLDLRGRIGDAAGRARAADSTSTEERRAIHWLSLSLGVAAVSLLAVPPEIEAGQEVDLIWTAFNARTASLKSSDGVELEIDAAAGSGLVALTPSRTETYTLTASGLDAANAFTATATVKVRPVVGSFKVAPHAALPGESLTLS